MKFVPHEYQQYAMTHIIEHEAAGLFLDMKVCIKCGEKLPVTLEYFSKRKSSKDGFRNECKKCRSLYNKQYKKDNEKAMNAYLKKYRNRKVNKDKAVEYMSIYGPKHYEKNKVEINKRHVIYNRAYIKTPHGRQLDRAKKHTRKALDFLNGGSYTPEQWEECLLYFDNRCAYTGELLEVDNTHVEHVTAISKGGTSYIWNICPSIGYANLSKNDNDIDEWFRKQKYFSEERLQKIYSWIEYAKFVY